MRGAWLRHTGRGVRCPLCGWGFRAFADLPDRRGVVCPRCGSYERHRAQWLLLDRLRPELLRRAGSLLHLAPEPSLVRRLRGVAGLRHVTADLAAPGVDLHLDVQRLELPDAAFGAVLCSHVLEHVPDDRAAMRELRRVLRPDGWALVAVPQSPRRAHTFEDPAATGADERLRAYGQADHVRQYGDDIVERLREAGFAVESLSIAELVGPRAARRHGLLATDVHHLCAPSD